MADTPDQPFTWGAGGARLTPEQIADRRKVADALTLQAGDGSAFPVGTRGAGLVTQGLNRLAKGVSAGMDYREADQAATANAADNKAMIAALLGGGAQAAPVAASPAPQATVAPPTSPVASVPVQGGAPVEIHSADEPNPLDQPTGVDRDHMIRTIYGEAGNEPTQGQLAVANVIRNRAVDGGYGGHSISDVVHAPNQFEPWNRPDATARMMALDPASPQYAAISKVVDAAYGAGGKAPEDPTEGKTMFYSPTAQAALGRPVPTWAKGPGQDIGGHRFFDDEDGTAAPLALAAAPPGGVSPGVAAVTAAAGGQPAPVATPAAPAASPLAGINPAVLQAATSPYADDSTKKIASALLAAQLGKEKKDTFTPGTDADGNQYDVNNTTHERKMFNKVAEDPQSVREYEYYKKNPTPGQPTMDYATWATAKARASATNVTTNIDPKAGETYDSQLATGLGKSHAALANGVEDAQTRARDIAAMQGAVDAIQKNGGTTGGMGQQQILKLKNTINAGGTALGFDEPFDEKDISDKEFLTKFNRSMAGAQAKGAMGSRVTNFEMGNYLKANPGLDMSITGNQRLLGIQGQIEQRNIAVGNAIREETAKAIQGGKHVDPVTVQHLITAYDEVHHIKDPITGQDLTQSYTLPEFQTGGNNAALAVDHSANVTKIGGYTIKPVSP